MGHSYRVGRRQFLITAAAAALGMRIRFPSPEGPVPSPRQRAWQDWELGMFFHFGINTFTDSEWGNGDEDPRQFSPERLDTRQWVRAPKAAGFQYIILTAKHHDGFCLWPSSVTDHSVRQSPWRGGQGDIVREFTDAAHAEGLGPGVYLSPWDRHEPCYGNTPRYNDFYISQLPELLTRYGPLVEVWFDGANGEGPNGRHQVYDWPRIHRTVRELQPNALIFSDSGPDIRWIGNERGIAGDPNWCPVNPDLVPEPGLDAPEVVEALQHGNPPPEGRVWRAGETPVSIRPGWFWHEVEDNKQKSADELFEIYCMCVGRNANLLLNVPPTREGLLHPTDVRILKEFGDRVREMYAHAAQAGGDMKSVGKVFTLRLKSPAEFDTAIIEEEIASGQTIAAYRLEAWTERKWSVIARGSTIGHKKIDRFAHTSTDRIRVIVEESIGQPSLKRVRLARTGVSRRG